MADSQEASPSPAPAGTTSSAVATDGTVPAPQPVDLFGALSGAGSPHMIEAQAAWRDGELARRAGHHDEARRNWTEAAQLDPSFPDPHFAIAASWLPFRPDLAGGAWMDGVRSAWRTFRGQHRFVVNAALLILAVITFSLVATALLVTLRGLRHFQHPVFEMIHRRLPAAGAALAAWVIVLQPLLWGIGLFLTLVLAAGLLWFYVGRGERKVFAAFAALALFVPLAFHGLSRLSSPLDPDSVPYLLSAASETPSQPGLAESLQRAMRDAPDDPAPHMALGLIEESAKQLDKAEAEYRRALELSGDEARLRNNLGNVLARTARLDDAVTEYQRAIHANGILAAPHYNLSQLYARRLQFDLADQEMKQASRLDFEGIRSKTAGSRHEPSGLLSLGLAPRELWTATFAAPARFPLGLPRALGWLYGGSMTLLPVLAAVLFVAGMLIGRGLHRFLPTYSCSNCDSIVCRKCLRRIRRRAYCASCGDTILSMQTSEFTRMLLERRLKEEHWGQKIARWAMMLAIPGWEAVRRGRPLIGLTVMTTFMVLLIPTLVAGEAVRAVPALAESGRGPLWSVLLPGLVVLYALSGILLKLVPEPESALIGHDLQMAPGRSDPFDRAA